MQVKGLSNLNIDIKEKDVGKVIRVFNDYQLRVKGAFSDVIEKQIINGLLHKEVEVTLGTDLEFEHKLGRTPLGLIAVNYDDGYKTDFVRVDNDVTDILNLTPMFYTDWIAYTPTDSAFTYSGTNSHLYRLNGNCIDINAKILDCRFLGAGYINMPAGISIDYSRLPSPTHSIIGRCTGYDVSAGAHYLGLVETNNGNDSYQFVGNACGTWTTNVPFVWNNPNVDDLAYQISELPVSGVTKKVSIWVF